jgi:uncharacterized membrane protein YphA (DoxX/SURF4 family)
MSIPVRIIQVLVGVLFVISGLVKANDPLGLAYKMEEYFELWNGELLARDFFLNPTLINLFDFLHQHSVALSVFMITLEIAAGVALLLSWQKKFILYLLLALMIFFTWLTGYAYLSGKFTNCGCFGDCIPITPATSFIKDIVLLVLIGILLAGQRYLQPVLSTRTSSIILTSTLLVTLLLQWYVLNYLPLADCLPFKKGADINKAIRPPANAIQDSTAIRYIYEKDGKRFEWAPEELPADFGTYTYVDRIDKLVRKGNAVPLVKGFTLRGATGTDSTDIILNQPQCVLIFSLDIKNAGRVLDKVSLFKKETGDRLPVYLVTATSLPVALASLQQQGADSSIQVFNSDYTPIKTAARTDPSVYFLKKGVVAGKYSYRNLEGIRKHLTP